MEKKRDDDKGRRAIEIIDKIKVPKPGEKKQDDDEVEKR